VRHQLNAGELQSTPWCKRPAVRRMIRFGLISKTSPSSSNKTVPLRPKISTEESKLRRGWRYPGGNIAQPPNDSAYAETCATIGLIFWAHRMLLLEPDSSLCRCNGTGFIQWGLKWHFMGR
jgi:hypothetical protein